MIVVIASLLSLLFVLLYSGVKFRIPEQWRFLLKGRRMLIDRAEQNKGGPFSMLIPGNRLHLVSSKEHWDELNKTSINHLSSHAWSKQHFQPKHTFGYEWPDRRDDDGMPVVRAIRTMTNQFPLLKPKFVDIMKEKMDEVLEKSALGNGTSKLLLWDTVKHFASRMNMLMMFGDDLANTPEFVDRGLKYIDEVTFVSEAAKNFPVSLIPIFRWLITGRNLNQKYILQAISSEINGYRTSDDQKNKTRSILQGLVRNLPEASHSRILHDMNITFISSTTATPIIATQLIQDIFTHPEYLPALRKEFSGVLDEPNPDFTKLPLLEGFLVESMRTHCFLSTVVHRVPLEPFVFHDGYAVPKGEIVEFFQYRTMNDNEIYPNPERFDPERHRATGRAATDMGREWPFWGNSKLACPGRFHVSNVAKLIAIYFVMNYDCEFEDRGILSFEFRDILVPNPNSKVTIKRRI